MWCGDGYGSEEQNVSSACFEGIAKQGFPGLGSKQKGKGKRKEARGKRQEARSKRQLWILLGCSQGFAQATQMPSVLRTTG